jgi:hypothetical protein
MTSVSAIITRLSKLLQTRARGSELVEGALSARSHSSPRRRSRPMSSPKSGS